MKSNKIRVRDKKSTYVFTFLKYAFMLVFPILAVFINRMSHSYLLLVCAEALAVAIITNILGRTKYFIAYIFNSLVLFLINIQFAVLFFGNSFTTIIMLDNTDSIKDLWGKFIYYGIAIVFLIIFSFLPIRRFNIKPLGEIGIIVCVIALYVFIILTNRITFSPIYNTFDLCRQRISIYKTQKSVEAMSITQNEFLRDEVKNYIEKPNEIKNKPNVILILTEGLSENVIEDSRNITPNLKALEKKSISFTNYYNHTFATYMALSGQLYSGYQQNNYDKSNFTSIQDIFKQNGYSTTMINTEPKNKEFSNYLNSFNFDEIVTDTSKIDGMADSISDKSAYKLLLNTAKTKSNGSKPFFLSIYTFGTHTSLDGVYNQYKNGTNNFLDRFYDLDIQIGTFIKAFEQSDLFDNTVLIFTADHCSYQDTDFSNAYPYYRRKSTVIDTIPLMIYYKGVTPETYDALGRNSLDMAPTVLDFLDLSGKNSFLGESLFSFGENTSIYNTVFQSYSTYYSTKNKKIKNLPVGESDYITSQIEKYFYMKTK